MGIDLQKGIEDQAILSASCYPYCKEVLAYARMGADTENSRLY